VKKLVHDRSVAADAKALHGVAAVDLDGGHHRGSGTRTESGTSWRRALMTDC